MPASQMQRGSRPPPAKPRRLDYWLVNTAALAWSPVETGLPETTAGVHHAVQLTLRQGKPAPVPTVAKPPRLPVEMPTCLEQKWAQIMVCNSDVWLNVCKSGSTDNMWSVWCDMVCDLWNETFSNRGNSPGLVLQTPMKHPMPSSSKNGPRLPLLRQESLGQKRQQPEGKDKLKS